MFPQGCRAFRGISPNVEAEESGMRDDIGMQDVQYTEVHNLQPVDMSVLSFLPRFVRLHVPWG